MRQTIARRMTESKKTAPHFYVTVEINMDETMKMRDQLNSLAPETERISVNDLIVAAAARTLARFPALNASYRDGKPGNALPRSTSASRWRWKTGSSRRSSATPTKKR